MTERETLEHGLDKLLSSHSGENIDKLLTFSQILLEKNKHMNLTATTTPLEVVTRHFLDCAVICEYVSESVIDVGTGAGFPGIPLAVLCPDTKFVLIDAQKKRVDFLKETISELRLKNCTAVHARAEDYAREHRETFRFAVSRAVAELRILCELSLPLVQKNGCFIAMKAERCTEETATAYNAISVLGGGSPKLIFYEVPFTNTRRALVLIPKERETPEKYPRRFKKLSKSPL